MLEKLVNMFIMLFVVVDPIGVTPLFGPLTRSGGHAYRRRMAFKSTLLAAAILLIFACIGGWLLKALGVSIPAFKIAGGILLFLIAIDMVFPLAFPLIAGPGALATILLMVSEARGHVAYFIGVIAVLLLVLAITLVCLLAAGRLMKLLGETGANVVGRLFGVILAALAVQFVIDGVKAGFFS